MEGKQLHPLLLPHPRLPFPGLLPHLPTSRFRRLHHRKPKATQLAAAAAVEAQEEDDEEWEAALQQWKSKTYALSVPLRVVALRGSFPPTWVKDFVEAQGNRLKFSPEFRTSIDTLFTELSQCVEKGEVQSKSAMAADVVSIGDSWLGYAIRKGLVEPIKNAEEQDWYRSLSDRWKEPEWGGRF